MKIILTYILIFLSCYAYGETYYVSNDGNDTNNGLTPETSWKNTSKVRSYVFSVGDSILFNSGDEWTDYLRIYQSGSEGAPIYVGKYGTGDDPILQGVILANISYLNIYNIYSKASDSRHCFEFVGCDNMHVYQCTANGMENNIKHTGILCWWYSPNNEFHDVIIEECEVFDCGDPNQSGPGGGIKLSHFGRDCKIINNIVYNNRETNIQVYSGSEHYVYNIEISGNDIHNLLPFKDEIWNGSIPLYESGINVGVNTYNVDVFNNKIENVIRPMQFDAGSNNNKAYNNIIKNGRDCSFQLLANSHGDNDSSYFCNNTIINTNGEYLAGISMQIYAGSAITNAVIKNNLIYSTTNYFRPFNLSYSSAENNTSDFDFDSDYNMFYVDAANVRFSITNTVGGSSNLTSLTSWQSIMSVDANSIYKDPLVDTTTFKVSSLSPAIDAGATISTVIDDYFSTLRPQNLLYDIGAYEYPVIAPVDTHIELRLDGKGALLRDINGAVIYKTIE